MNKRSSSSQRFTLRARRRFSRGCVLREWAGVDVLFCRNPFPTRELGMLSDIIKEGITMGFREFRQCGVSELCIYPSLSFLRDIVLISPRCVNTRNPLLSRSNFWPDMIRLSCARMPQREYVFYNAAIIYIRQIGLECSKICRLTLLK